MRKGTVLEGLISGDEVRKALTSRKAREEYKSVRHSLVDGYLTDGWRLVRKNKRTTRLCRPKAVGRALEDEVWALLGMMGFQELNAGPGFRIPLAKESAQLPPRQVDVFAKDEATALIVECKESATPTRRPLQKEIGELSDLRAALTKAVRQHYGRDVKLKVAVLMVTRNIQWGENDLQRAQAGRIYVMRDEDIDYYRELTERIDHAARYQLLADIFAGQEIPELQLTVPALRGKMGGKVFYSFVVEPDRLLRIAFVSHRAKVDTQFLVSYQRMLKKNRLKVIAHYINDKGIFPTSVVISLRCSAPARFDKKSDAESCGCEFGLLHLPSSYKSAWVVDGQHRLYGFALSDWAAKATIPVIAFEKLTAPEEARMFVDINHEQVKVPKNVLVDLAADLYWDSSDPDDQIYALTSKIASALGTNILSPLRGRIAGEGRKQTPDRPITLTAMYDAVRRSGLLGTVSRGLLHPGPLYDYDAASTLKRATDTYVGYLGFFEAALRDHWSLGSAEGGYLCTNNGVTALLLLLSGVIQHLDRYSPTKPKHMPADGLLAAVEPYVMPVITYFQSATPSDFRALRRLVGSSGQRSAAFSMMELVRSAKPSFDPDGLEDYIRSKDTAGTEQARLLMPEIQLTVREITLKVLKEMFGEGGDSWWRSGVPQVIRAEVASRRETSPEGGEIEDFFELIDYKKIADKNWTAFQKYFSIGRSRRKDDQLAWFDRLNTIRNRVAHPERGPIGEDDVEFLRLVQSHLDAVRS